MANHDIRLYVDASNELVTDKDMLRVQRNDQIQWVPEFGTSRVEFKGLSPLEKAVIDNVGYNLVRPDASPGVYKYKVIFHGRPADGSGDKLYSDDSSPAIIVEL